MFLTYPQRLKEWIKYNSVVVIRVLSCKNKQKLTLADLSKRYYIESMLGVK